MRSACVPPRAPSPPRAPCAAQIRTHARVQQRTPSARHGPPSTRLFPSTLLDAFQRFHLQKTPVPRLTRSMTSLARTVYATTTSATTPKPPSAPARSSAPCPSPSSSEGWRSKHDRGAAGAVPPPPARVPARDERDRERRTAATSPTTCGWSSLEDSRCLGLVTRETKRVP